MEGIRIKKELVNELAVEETKCCFQVNKLTIYCVVSSHCVGISESLVRYMKV